MEPTTIPEEPITILDLLHEALHADPFRPFLIRARGHKTFPVSHPSRAFLVFNRRAVAIGDDCGIFAILNLSGVVSLEFLPQSGTRS